MILAANFTCTDIQSIFVCKANNLPTLALLQRLQETIRKACTQLIRVDAVLPKPCLFVPPDGVVGPLTAVGAQHIVVALNRWIRAPRSLRGFLLFQPNERDLVQLTGEAADELVGYIEYVLSVKPSALVEAPPAELPKTLRGTIDAGIKSKLKTIAMVGVGAGTAGGLAYLGRKMSRRLRGLEDRAEALPGFSEDDDSLNEE